MGVPVGQHLTHTRWSPVLMALVILGVLASGLVAAPAGAAADPIVGDWNVTYGAPGVVTMTLANGVYTETAATPVRVVTTACDLAVGTKIATFSASGQLTYAGQHGLWNINCGFAFFTTITLTLSPDGATLTGSLGDGESFTFTRPAPTPTPSPTPAASCSRATARALLLSRHLGNPPEPEGQVLCGHFTGRHSNAMVVSLSTPGCGGSIGWLVFRHRHGAWSVVLRRDNGARLSAVGRGIRETLAILRPTDPHCVPTGGTRSRTWHWTRNGFVHSRFRRDTAWVTAPALGSGTATIRFARAGGRPVCTYAAIHRAIAHQEHPSYRWTLAGPQCAGRFAVVGLEDITDGAEFTRLLRWSKTNRWLLINRFLACARGQVPVKIRMVTCGSN
jgi:hypothetical protein